MYSTAPARALYLAVGLLVIAAAGTGCSAILSWEGEEPQFCGDGVVSGAEVCDDGNATGGDGCSADCLSDESCGNGIVDGIVGEACDDASDNGRSGNECRGDCQVTTCGDGYIGGSEQCEATALGGEDCRTLGFDGGSLSCTGACFYDTGGCISCGDGVCQEAEGEDHKTCQADCGAVDITAGRYHTCIVRADGAVFCWGGNGEGQLGTGNTIGTNTPIRVPLIDDAVSVATGERHTCAVRRDGTAYCWGSNSDGQLGNGSTANSLSPVGVAGLTQAVAVSVGFAHSCALLTDGTARCWGRNDDGQLGTGNTTSSPVPVLVAGVGGGVEIASGTWSNNCVVTGSGSVTCWGTNNSGQFGVGPPQPITTPVAVWDGAVLQSFDIGFNHACALQADGAVTCSGANYYGQIGPNGGTGSEYPVAVPGVVGIAVGCGWEHSCAIRQDGTVTCWGEVGGANPTVIANVSDAVQLAGDWVHHCAITGSGGVYCWGSGFDGQLGHGVDEWVDTTAVSPIGFEP